jgi:peptidoglycan/LPS O-acetylase OafA/YrhL
MWRERALKIVLVLVGLLFAAAIYPVVMALLHPSPSDDTGDTMMMSLYFTLGAFLLVAARNPSAHRSLIAFAAWSSFAHAAVMSLLGLHIPSERRGFLIASAVLVLIGVALLAMAPPKQSAERPSPVSA